MREMAKRTRSRKAKQELIIRCLLEGVSLPVALRLAGVPRSTYYDWLQRYPNFASAVEQAEASALRELELLAFERCRAGDSPMTRFLLSKRLPELYGNQPMRADDYDLIIEEIPSPQDFEVVVRTGKES